MEAPMIDLTADRGPSVTRLSIAMMVIVIVAIILRFWSRAVAVNSPGGEKNHFWWDDWLALIAVPFAIAELSLALVWVQYDGLGKHVEAITTPQLLAGLKFLFVGQIVQNCALVAARLSVLFFYLRVSAGAHNMLMLNSVTFAMVISILYFVTFVLMAIFSCTPVQKSWLPYLPGHCLTLSTWWFWFAMISVLVDLVILVIPMSMLWNLQLKPWKRFGILCIFASGYCVLATAIGRVVSIHLTGDGLELDPTYESIPTLYWFIIEPGLAILSICLPSIFSLLKRGIYHGPKSVFSLKGTASSWTGPRSARSIPQFGSKKNDSSTDSQFERLHDANTDLHNNKDYIAMVGRGSQNGGSINEDTNQFIQVRTEYDVSKTGISTNTSGT
ncbi:hypothetical protein BPAE_0387g00040 [Botrytis paeoniae]|uniref:Rhodopsin domain-containing protein n=1 Tax=Botrytis paeoniae TaxID=278948 RepID=A0A4Z1F1Q7_9HELO|nr:hypothetical protein BPAE_0387g00040 [Botrytis paeoniae]